MAELKVYLSEELDKRFRKLAMSVHGYGKGSLSKAAEDAISKWCNNHEEKMSEIDSKNEGLAVKSDPVARAEERPTDSSSTNETSHNSLRTSG